MVRLTDRQMLELIDSERAAATSTRRLVRRRNMQTRDEVREKALRLGLTERECEACEGTGIIKTAGYADRTCTCSNGRLWSIRDNDGWMRDDEVMKLPDS
jgi:hypothetical protein